MPKAQLFYFTGKGTPDPVWTAADILIFTKSTRLTLSPEAFSNVQAMPIADKLVILEEMSKTIPSSWEFVDLVFLVTGVTRACAQQMTRTREASYAMQSQRIVILDDVAVTNPYDTDTLSGDALAGIFEVGVNDARRCYSDLIANGSKAEDARGILPMNTQCNILAKYNLRAFAALVQSRSSLRTQGEYADIVRQEEEAVRDAWPWVEPFLRSPWVIAMQELTAIAEELGVQPGNGLGWRLAKAMDLLRKDK